MQGGDILDFGIPIEFAIAIHSGDDPNINIVRSFSGTDFSQGKVSFKTNYNLPVGCDYFIKFK